MKKYIKEIFIFLIQFATYYIYPNFALNPMGMVFMIMFLTFILSIISGVILNNKIKCFYPLFISMLFIPSVFLYYNSSALVHFLWYFIVSSIGITIGIVFNKILEKNRKER